MPPKQNLTIGEIARRTGLAVSAIRFYEEKGLVHPVRDGSGRRRFSRADIRRLSFVLISQQLGFSLERIGALLATLPAHRSPTKADWTRISRSFAKDIDKRIARLTSLREKLDGCMGCGCLSLRACTLYNPQDSASAKGHGPRYLIGDSPPHASREKGGVSRVRHNT